MKKEEINWTCGAALVQAEGRVGNKWWYFRSRHEHYRFSVADTLMEAIGGEGFNITKPFGTQESEASWMELDTAAEIISECLDEYEKSNESN
jgi:hypothetical protein